MSTNFNHKPANEAEEARINQVIMALENPNYDWRTIEGVSKETHLSLKEVQEILRKLGRQVIQSSIPDKRGRPLYTTREHYQRRKLGNPEVVANRTINRAINQLSEVQPEDILKIAGVEIQSLKGYYDLALGQAKQSFRWALIAAGVGLIFFLGAIAFLLITQSQSIAIVNVVCGVIIEGISGLNFYLYGQTTKQLAYYHRQLDQTQRFLLANSICEALEGESRQKARSDLITLIITFGVVQAPIFTSEEQRREKQR